MLHALNGSTTPTHKKHVQRRAMEAACDGGRPGTRRSALCVNAMDAACADWRGSPEEVSARKTPETKSDINFKRPRNMSRFHWPCHVRASEEAPPAAQSSTGNLRYARRTSSEEGMAAN